MEAKQDLVARKSLKDNGQMNLSIMVSVGTINEEILKKGLEIYNLMYAKSLANVKNDRFYDESI